MDDLIFNQHHIPKDQWRYGFRPSAATGCGWIAVHNALRLMDYPVNIDELIRWFERQLPLIHGNFGTTVWTPALRMRKYGFPVKIVVRSEGFDEAAKHADTCILFYRWWNRRKLAAHFVALHHTPEGFIGYNTFKTSAGPDHYGPSLAAFLKKQRFFGAVLICITDKRRT